MGQEDRTQIEIVIKMKMKKKISLQSSYQPDVTAVNLGELLVEDDSFAFVKISIRSVSERVVRH